MGQNNGPPPIAAPAFHSSPESRAAELHSENSTSFYSWGCFGVPYSLKVPMKGHVLQSLPKEMGANKRRLQILLKYRQPSTQSSYLARMNKCQEHLPCPETTILSGMHSYRCTYMYTCMCINLLLLICLDLCLFHWSSDSKEAFQDSSGRLGLGGRRDGRPVLRSQ